MLQENIQLAASLVYSREPPFLIPFRNVIIGVSLKIILITTHVGIHLGTVESHRGKLNENLNVNLKVDRFINEGILYCA